MGGGGAVAGFMAMQELQSQWAREEKLRRKRRNRYLQSKRKGK